MGYTEDLLKELERRNISTKVITPSRSTTKSASRKKKEEEYEAELLRALQTTAQRNSNELAMPEWGTVTMSPIQDNDIAPVLTTAKKEEDEGLLDFFQKGAFSDGYQFGDVTKSILGTAGDVGLGVVKGAARTAEGVADLATYGIAALKENRDPVGAAEMRKRAQQNTIDEWTKKPTEFLDKYSVAGRTIDSVSEAIGQIGTIIATGGAGAAVGLGKVGVTALTTGSMGLSGMGSGMSEAYAGGATDKEAVTYGAIAGAADALTELIFGGLGRTIKATGLSTGLSSADDMLAKKVSGLFTSQITKNFAEYGIKAGAEGFEEVLAGVAQGIGKKITYMKEEELLEIIKDENLLEQFIVGAAASGMMQAGYIPGTREGSLREANKENRDFITGYDQNEQAVVKAETERRISEAEKDGKKLSSKERANIEATVEKALERGEISVDTIEELLGGDTFSAYKKVADAEAAMRKEYAELGGKEKFTLADHSRFKELEGQIKESEKAGWKSELKERLDKEVSTMVQGSRLAESFNQTAQRRQAFAADVTQYDEQQRAIVQKAIDSGVLNNTRRSHELVDLVAKIGAEKGLSFDFANNAKLKESGLAVEGKTVNGFLKDGTVTLNVEASKALNSVVGHEIAHVLEGTEVYAELQKAVFEYAKTKKDFSGRRGTLKALYQNVEGANIDGELTADLIGDYLFTDEAFVRNLSTKHRNVFQKIYDEIKYLVKIATAGSKEARELERVKKLFDKAYRESGEVKADEKAEAQTDKQASGTRYSLTEDQQKNFDYNHRASDVGSTLKTLKGSSIKRSSKYGVGKEIGGEIYFHKSYAEEIVPPEVLSQAEHLLEESNPGFEYNCLKYNPKTGVVAFQEAPDFDTAREPVVGDYVSVNTNTGDVKTGHSNYIWHHKWNWVKNDYSGFDVAEAWNWSKQWLSTLTEVSDGNGIARWNAQLDKFGLPHDGAQSGRVQYSLTAVDPVQPKNGNWKRTHTTAEAMAIAAEKGIAMWDVAADYSNEKNPTSMTLAEGGTTQTYRKVFGYLGGNYKGRILDASSGQGYGTRVGRDMGYDITDIEPYPDPYNYQFVKDSDESETIVLDVTDKKTGKTKKVKRIVNKNPHHPDYMDYSALDEMVARGDVEPYDFIISNAVLNVLPQDQRDALVRHMGNMLADGGQMFVNVRTAAEIKTLASKEKNAKLGETEAVESSGGSYQYGFTNTEIVDYLKDALGDGFTVVDGRKLFGTSSPTALVTKKGGVQYSLSTDSEASLVENYREAHKVQYNLAAVESHQKKLQSAYAIDKSAVPLDTINKRYAKILEVWERLGGELDSKFMREWDSKVKKDRAFTVFKAQTGYKYNIELSSMCKKGVPLFEAIDTIVKQEVMKELDTKVLGKAEKEVLYDILKQHHFEIPCAICYVEQARQREGGIINSFLNGRTDTDKNGNVTGVKLGWNQVIDSIEAEMKANGVSYTFPFVSRDIATDRYTPEAYDMDEETQDAFYAAAQKLLNEEIARSNAASKKSRKMLEDVSPAGIKAALKGTLPDNLKIFKVLLTDPSSRFRIQDDLLYSSLTTQNLSAAHSALYTLFNGQGGVSGYKTKQGTTIYWGDILSKKWTSDGTRKEGGIRNQSNSDFQMYTLLDQAQMYIDFTAKGYYLQAYTKVLSELKLFGLSNGKINASLIPRVIEYKNADGTVDVERTMENAGLDENGDPIYDDIEGIDHSEAFMLITDPEYSKSLTGICIGYSDKHISKLLDDPRVQLIIGYHDNTNDPDKRYRGARYATNYTGRNEAVNANGETVHLNFNPYIVKAEKMFKHDKKSGTFSGEVTYNGKAYTADDIPKLAADLYLEMCAEKGYRPAYYGFHTHQNYYKLLADFGLYDSEGHYAPHKKVAYNMPDRVPYLDAYGNKQYMLTEDYIKKELEKELRVRDSISEALADRSPEGIIPQFISRVNALHSGKASLSEEGAPRRRAYGDFNTYGEDVKLETAPTESFAPMAAPPVEDIAPVADAAVPEDEMFPNDIKRSADADFAKIDRLYEDLDELDNLYQVAEDQLREAREAGDSETAAAVADYLVGVDAEREATKRGIQAELANFAPMTEEDIAYDDARLASIEDADAPPVSEVEYDAEAESLSIPDKEVDKIAKAAADSGIIPRRQGAELKKLIRRVAAGELSRDGLLAEITDRYGKYTEVEVLDDVKEVKDAIRSRKLNVSKYIQHDFPDYGHLMRSYFGKVRFSKQGQAVDQMYDELSAIYPGFFPPDVLSGADQLLKIFEVADMSHTSETGYAVGERVLAALTDTIFNSVTEAQQSQSQQIREREAADAFNGLMADADRYAPPVEEDIAPVAAAQPVEAPAAPEAAEDKTIKTVKDRLTAKLNGFQTELDENIRLREESNSAYDALIARLQAEYDGKRNKNTKAANDILRRIERAKSSKASVDADYAKRISDLGEKVAKVGEELRTGESAAEQGAMRRELHAGIVENIRARFAEDGYDLETVLDNAKDLSTISTVDNTPQRVMEKALGYKEGQILADLTVNKVAQNETDAIRWLNGYTNRKSGVLAQLSKKYGIKPGSKESAAAQMYAEGFYVAENDDIIEYGDRELAMDFPDARVQANIKGLARDPVIRQIYDETLERINASRARNAYPEIQKLDNYFLHFRAMDDTFSRLGIPFNPNDIRAKDLPTDLNGVTADLKPGQPYFASAMHRRGKRTSFDLLGGLEMYLSSAKNQIYHIDDIQTLRALRNHIADTYGQAHGLEGLDEMTEEEAEARIEDVYGAHLSTFAKFLNEEANVIAGKTALIDRGLEGIIGRRGITTLDTINRQVGANMVGFNVSSSLTNLLSVVQAIAKTSKYDVLKAFTQTASNALNSIRGKSDGFMENNPTAIRRKGAERFYRTPWQKASDAGYFLMGAVDNISTELIVRAKYNEFTRKGMSAEDAVIAADKWASRLMGDRSLGQQPQLYNSKMLGLFTKFQLEVRNQLDSQFYDTIQEAKVSTEDIQNAQERNAKKAAKIASTFFQLAVLQHLFGKAFESVAGYNPAFDIIGALIKLFGWDDDEEDEDTALDNIEQGFLELIGDLPYTSTLTGGRIPISSALPVAQFIKGKDQYGNDKSRLETLGEAAPYYVLPGGYGQIKKTVQGLEMFDINDEHPVAGSYTDSGNLRFPVEDTFTNRAQAAIFGQWASANAREYFDEEYAPLKPNQIQEYMDVDLPIADYRAYREGLSGKDTLGEKVAYIAGLDLPIDKKNLLINNIADRKDPIDLTNYGEYDDWGEFEYAHKYPEKYAFLEANNISVAQYEAFDEDTKEAWSWAYQNPEKFTLSKAVADDVAVYRQYTAALNDITADKTADGKSISGSRKDKVVEYINTLDADYGEKIILFKSEYPADDTYNYEIIEYLNGREDITYNDMVTILKELDFTVLADGTVQW